MATQSTPTLNATVRTGSGKGVARRLRAEGLIPAICYGQSVKDLSLSINPDEFDKITGEPTALNTVFDLELDNGDTVNNVMVRDYQVDPLRREVIHADLVVVNPDEAIKMRIPIAATGKAKGVAMGGRLRFIQPTVELFVRPNDVPTEITVDVTNLTVEGAIMAGDLVLPEGVAPAYKMDHAIIRIQMPRTKKIIDVPVGDDLDDEDEEESEESSEE